MTWHPGSDPAQATRMEVTFADVADGCRVELVHSGWEVRAAGAGQWRDLYEGDWTAVLESYQRASAKLWRRSQ